MPRLHTLYLPGNGEGMPFAFILDQVNPMSVPARNAWESFANQCGARAIMFTAETIDIDPEPADEPIDYYTTDHSGCDHPPLPDILDLVRAAHAAAWVPWEPANLDPESGKISTHREEVCPALNNSAVGCPMHAPILEGPWVAWPYYAAHTADGTVISRICEHGITHPTPEEYFSGFNTPHLCDGCPCAPVPDFSIVVSDLANTKLPRGTLLLGVKDDPTPVTAPPAPRYESSPRGGLVPVRVPDLMPCDGTVTLTNGVERPCLLGFGHRGGHMVGDNGYLLGIGGPFFLPEGEGPIAFVAEDMAPDWVEKQAADVRCGSRFQLAAGSIGCNLSSGHEGAHTAGGMTWTAHVQPLATSEKLGDWVRVQPLGTDGEPVGEAKDYPLAGPVTITEKAYVDPDENCFCGLPMGDCEHDGTKPAERWSSAEIELTHLKPCGAANDRGPCISYSGHEGLHDFGPFTRI